MTSQLSQPSASISWRLVGRNGAVPKHSAQYRGYPNRSEAASAIALCTEPSGAGYCSALRRSTQSLSAPCKLDRAGPGAFRQGKTSDCDKTESLRPFSQRGKAEFGAPCRGMTYPVCAQSDPRGNQVQRVSHAAPLTDISQPGKRESGAALRARE